MADFESWLEKQTRKPDSRTRQAMTYALMAGGKRVRPKLLLAALQDYGVDPVIGYPAAAALEMIHTYSLIHDDLPAMDDDDLRRGKPSTHVAFDEATAILAGDGLLTEAFYVILQSPRQHIPELVEILSRNAGPEGMILGQTLDLKAESEEATLAQLEDIDRYKTGCLISAALEMAAILAGHPEDQAAMQEIGEKTGLAFQIRDDILDVTSTADAMGKSLSDEKNDKSTFVRLLGLQGARNAEKDYEMRADLLLKTLHMKPVELKKQLDQLQKRSR